MNESEFAAWANEISAERGYVVRKRISKAYLYSLSQLRCVAYDIKMPVEKNGSISAVLKLIDDPRVTFEVQAQDHFNQVNESQYLIAPKVFEKKIISAHKSWMVMEKLPEDCIQLSQPLPVSERGKFLKIFMEYRRHAPQESNRKLTFVEKMSSYEFHCFRIGQWLQPISNKDADTVISGKEPLLGYVFLPLFERGLHTIRQIYGIRKQMMWSAHGLFKPEDIYRVDGKDIYYLTDFCRAKMYPVGYEIASIIWSDWIMSADWQMDFVLWNKGIFDWLIEIRQMYQENQAEYANVAWGQDENEFGEIIKACLIERILGTILADVCGTMMPRDEQEQRLLYLYRYLDELYKY